MFKKIAVLVICSAFLGSLIVESLAKPPRSSGRSSSSYRPSSSRSSRPSSSRPSPSRRPPSRPSTSSSKPKFGSSSSSKKPSSSRPSTSKKPKFGSSSSSKKPTTSRKPSTSTSAKSKATQKAASKRTYAATKKATKPPKKSYTTSSGRTVNVRANSSSVKTIRSRPSSYYTPVARQQRMSVHITSHYNHPYSYYNTQPHYYVGGGYSSSFWYMMGEWSAERRARWLYHNRHNIESSAYQRGMQDAQVSQHMRQFESQNLSRNTDYVDSEFVDNPGMQYSQDYIEASYNPTVRTASSSYALTILIWLVVFCIVGTLGYLFVTKVRFK